MAITGHFIDDSWRLQSHILRFVYVPAPHDKETLCSTLVDCLFEWNLERRISTITVDNASTNNAMMRTLLDEKLNKRDLLLIGRVFHVRCAAHILNLIVQEGLKKIEIGIVKVRESVLYWIWSQGRVERSEEAACVLRTPCSKKLSYDPPTRSRLHPTTLEALMCARTSLWNEINGFTSTIDNVPCPTLLEEEEEPECVPFPLVSSYGGIMLVFLVV